MAVVEWTEVSRHESGLVYFIVELWFNKADADAGLPADVSNDFLMMLPATVTRIARHNSGRLIRADGVLVREQDVTEADDAIGWQYTTVTRTETELFNIAKANVLEYWERYKASQLTAKPYPAKHDNRDRMRRNLNDPDGVLAKLAGRQGTREEIAG